MFADIVNGLWSVVATVWQWFVDLVQAVLVFFRDLLLNLLYALLDVSLGVFESIVSAIPVPAAWQSVGNPLGSLSGQALYLLTAFGIPECIAIIGGAYGVRFLLNLIPAAFTRV